MAAPDREPRERPVRHNAWIPAVVTVIVKEIRSRPVYFVGGFAKPGAMQLTGDLTLLQAISRVGGVTPEADGEKGFLYRIRVDVDRIIRSRDGNQDVRLHPNDISTVPQRRF